ncbi:MAG: proteasome subunit alpha [Candidatus Latescibacteria bacterium]|jgi:proteasome alpha subunit|nr:proteasome subunit alpha [Candidatus Latescibacterota bacterium]
MHDEPYRWAEAVANRREYIEDQLRGGSPVVGLGYEDGVVLVTLGQGQQKLFEIHDRIGLAALGHPTDIEKLRQAGVDLASVIGFNYSEADVTLQQIIHFGLGPAVKAAFDEIFRSPYIARLLLSELGEPGEAVAFYTVDYDGSFLRTEGSGAVGGTADAERMMHNRLQDGSDDGESLDSALGRALLAWGAGWSVGQRGGGSTDTDDLEKELDQADLPSLLREALDSMTVEAVVLDLTQSGKGKYRVLSEAEIEPALEAYRS